MDDYSSYIASFSVPLDQKIELKTAKIKDKKLTAPLDRSENLRIEFEKDTEINAHIFENKDVYNVQITGTVSVKVTNIISNSERI